MPARGMAARPRARAARRALPLASPALVLAAALLVLLRRYVTDDTFIHCVFARNLAVRGEFAFNPGQPVYGDTSPLWVGVLALVARGGADLLGAAKVLAGASALVV